MCVGAHRRWYIDTTSLSAAMSCVVSAPSSVCCTMLGHCLPPSATVSFHSTGLYWLSDISNMSDQ
jgi:hypothetical protein